MYLWDASAKTINTYGHTADASVHSDRLSGVQPTPDNLSNQYDEATTIREMRVAQKQWRMRTLGGERFGGVERSHGVLDCDEVLTTGGEVRSGEASRLLVNIKTLLVRG